ncbi:MAG: 50S ribosomal protein L23 [Patescibacteria group bacterium]
MQVILAPIISEKSMNQAGKGKFTFRVEKTADKIQIRKEIEDKFKVNVLSVATSMVKGKKRRFGSRRAEVQLSGWKKATVKLKEGQKIAIFDTASTEASQPIAEAAQSKSKKKSK